MSLHGISYKEANAKLYVNDLPTVHHIDILLFDNVKSSRDINEILLQCTLCDLALQRTHGILNPTDRNLRHLSKLSSTIRNNGGQMTYLVKNSLKIMACYKQAL